MRGIDPPLDHVRRGFTLVELIVVVFVVALLVAIIIPAVQTSREAARKSQCAHNLKQISTAIHGYSSIYQCLPLAHAGGGASPHVSILPFMEQNAIYNSINLNSLFHANSAANSTALSWKIAMYYCPSDGAFESSPTGGTNYCGNRGSGVQLYGYNGVFTFPSLPVVRIVDIADGTSNTAMMSEWLGATDDDGVRKSKIGIFRTRTGRLGPEDFEGFVVDCEGLDPQFAPLGAPPSKGGNWLFGEFGFTLYNHTLPPNQNSCTNGTAFQQGIWTASSNHAQGVNVLFSDGHSQFVRESIDFRVWRGIGSRNGGEIISGGDF